MFRQRKVSGLAVRSALTIGVLIALLVAVAPTVAAQSVDDENATETPPEASAEPTAEPTPEPDPTAEPTVAPAAAAPPPAAFVVTTSTVFINEFHYDNAGGDVGEFIEVAAPVGTDLTGWSIELYNGSNSMPYNTVVLSGVVGDQLDGYGTIAFTLPANGLQNGSPDGLALADTTNTLVQFISYEGTITAIGGVADGQTSTDVAVSEPGDTPAGQSLQLIGSGTVASDFTWSGPAPESPGSPNAGQSFSGVGPTPTPTPTSTPTPPAADLAITEFHYDNAGTDVGEFIEITGPADADLTGWSIELYNGSNGMSYDSILLAGAIDNENGVAGAVAVDTPGLQNGSPDGFALVAPDNSVVSFLSYEGTLTATDGPAAGLTSTDVGVSEPGSTPIGQSLQLINDVWVGPTTDTAGQLNAPPAPFVSEIHYDNAGTDVGEFIEVSGPAGSDLVGWTIELYNGSNGATYNTINLSGVIDDEGAGSGALDFQLPANGLQNGSPDGLALVDPDGIVVEFLSYEGEITATSGPALGTTSTDIGVAETGSTAVGQSLQLLDGEWIGPETASPGNLNTAPVEPPDVVAIHEVQGSGDASPLVGQQVRISGIVVGDFQSITTNDPTDAPLDGFFVQEEDADADLNPATSEGIFVYDPGGLDVAVGDLVVVTGVATEFFTLTEIGNVSDITVVSSGNDLPTPASPVVPTAVGDPTVDWEAIEGMSVTFSQPLFVTGMFPLGRYGELQLSAIGAQDHPNQTNAVGSAEAAAQRQLNLDARVILDDGEDENESFPNGLDTWNPNPTPYLGGPDGTLRSGDVVSDLTGVVHFSFGEFEVQPVNVADPNDPDGAVTITRTPRPSTVPSVGGSLQVASFNVLNYFTTIDTGGAQCGPPSNPQGCRGADSQAEFDLQSAKIAAAIAGLDADIVGLIELENNGTDAAISDLVAKVNTLTTRSYDYVPTGFIGGDAIAVGFIYDTQTVETAGDFAVLDSSVSAAFIDDKNRPVLAQTFVELETEATLTAAVAHLKSKGSPCDDVANPGDAAFGVAGYPAGTDVSDPNFQGNCNLTRLAAAQVLGQWIAQDPTGTPSDNLLIIGDLNAYQNEDPITALEGQGYTDLHALGGTSWADGGHSYVFDGEHGTLDYVLANPKLLEQVTGAAAWHINADEPFAIDYQDFNPPGQATTDAFKSSDHDPTIVGLDLTPPVPPGPQCNGKPATIIGTSGSDWIFGTSGDDVIVAKGGNDLVFGSAGNDTICLGNGRDWAFGGHGDDTIFGEAGRDVVFGGRGGDLLDGGDSDDFLQGDGGTDTILGGHGNDFLQGRGGDDLLDGGPGHDWGNGGRAFDTCVSVEFVFNCEATGPPD